MSKKSGKKARSKGSLQRNLPGMTLAPRAPDPAPAPPNGDIEALRAALTAAEAARDALARQVRELEAAVKAAAPRTPAPKPAARTAAMSPDDLGLAALSAVSPAEAKQAAYAGFEVWMLEATLRADAAAAGAAAATVPSAFVPHLLEAAAAAPAASGVDEQERLLARLRTARQALESAEARAAHSAAQVRRLSAELAAARSEHMRVNARLKNIESRLPAAAPPPAAPRSTLMPPPPLERAPAPERTPARAPEPAVPEAPAHDAPEVPSIEDALAAFGPPAAEQARAIPSLEQALAALAGTPASEPPITLEDALAAFGAAPPATEPPAAPAEVGPQESGPAPDPEMAEALLAFGAAAAAPAATPPAPEPEPTPAQASEPEPASTPEPQAARPPVELPAIATGDIEGLVEAMHEAGAVTMTQSELEIVAEHAPAAGQDAAAPATEAPVESPAGEWQAEETPAEEAPAGETGPEAAPESSKPDLYGALLAARRKDPVREAERAALRAVWDKPAAAAAPSTPAAMAGALRQWGGMDRGEGGFVPEAASEAEAEEAPAQGAEGEGGKTAMLNALMRFMGPK